MDDSFGAIILSGGRSERMNFPKAFLEIEGVSFLKKLVDTYKNVVSKVVIVLNSELTEPEWKNYVEKIEDNGKIILNHHSEKGKFHSLQLGARNIDCDYCFIQNVDNPFITSSTLDDLKKNKNANGITIPTYKTKGGHPILISKNVLEKISETANTNQHLKDFYSGFKRKYVEVNNESILMNINTLEDYEKFIAIKP